jgi:hypothetical protein
MTMCPAVAPPIEVFADRGKSAGRDDVSRADFNRLREWVRASKVTHLWAVEQSRFTGREIEWFEFAADLDGAAISEVHTNRDGIVRVSDEVAGIKAVLAAGERRKMLRRLHDTLAEKAAKATAGQGAEKAASGTASVTWMDGWTDRTANTGKAGIAANWSALRSTTDPVMVVAHGLASHTPAPPGAGLRADARGRPDRGARRHPLGASGAPGLWARRGHVLPRLSLCA